MTSRDWIIRRANLSDVDALRQCAEDTCADKNIVDFRKEIVEHPVWIAEYNNQLIGCIVLHLAKEAVHVVHVMLSPEYRDQGLGRFLINFAESEATKRQCVTVVVSLNDDHKEYLSLYEHLGWQKKGSDNGNIVMSKDIVELARESI